MRFWRLLGVLLLTGCGQATPPEVPAPITRLAPTAFLEVPVTIRQKLTTQGCQIPQVPGYATPQNIVSGAFAQAGQQDWVALCSKEGRTSLFIIWGGPVRCPNDLELSAETNFLSRDAQGQLVFGTHLEPVATQDITALNRRKSSIIPLPLSHEGIRQERMGTSALIQYCDQGKWFRLQEPQRKLVTAKP